MTGEFKQKYCEECGEHVSHLKIENSVYDTLYNEPANDDDYEWQCMSCDNDLGYGKES